MAKNYQDIAIAFAATCQAATLVQQFAHNGFSKDREDMATLMKSLLATQPDSTRSIYGDDLTHLKTGIETALAQLGGGNGKLDTEIGRYWVSLLSLSQKLNKSPEAKAQLVQRLQQIERQLSLYEGDIMADQMVTNLAARHSAKNPCHATCRHPCRYSLATSWRNPLAIFVFTQEIIKSNEIALSNALEFLALKEIIEQAYS